MTSLENIKDEADKRQNLESPCLQDIKDAVQNIASKAIKTPLVKLNSRAKKENKTKSGVRYFHCTGYTFKDFSTIKYLFPPREKLQYFFTFFRNQKFI